MKKLLNICLLLLTFLVVNSTELPKKRISLYIDLGKKSCNCCESGFCGAGITITWNQDNIQIAGEKKAFGYVEEMNGSLMLTLFKDSMTEKTVNTYFSNNLFIMGEDFELPKEICQELGIRNYTFLKGKYRVVDKDRTFIITF